MASGIPSRRAFDAVPVQDSDRDVAKTQKLTVLPARELTVIMAEKIPYRKEKDDTIGMTWNL